MKKDFMVSDFSTTLEEVIREGAQKLLQQAIQNEVEEIIEAHRADRTADNRRLVRRNGYLPERTIQTGVGHIRIQQPRVRGKVFSSAILPPYMRRTPSINVLIPMLYLKGISTGNMKEALVAILGDNAKGLSPKNIERMKERWIHEYDEWTHRDLSRKRYVYFWADGIYFTTRLSHERPCLLVILGALEDGSKELVAIHDGIRESALSWKETLRDLKKRGLKEGPSLAAGDGALGFWAALSEEFPESRAQRCWVHKTANVLDKMPKSVQEHARYRIHDIYMAPSRSEAGKAFEEFLHLYGEKYPKACECLLKNKEDLFAFYDFPAQHWQHIRTTNPIESTFATIRHRTRQTKGCGSRKATLGMVFQLLREAQKRWKKLRGYKQIPAVLAGIVFKDGERTEFVA